MDESEANERFNSLSADTQKKIKEAIKIFDGKITLADIFEGNTRKINSAYRNLAFKYHPDTSTDPSDEGMFRLLTEARNFLNAKADIFAKSDLRKIEGRESFILESGHGGRPVSKDSQVMARPVVTLLSEDEERQRIEKIIKDIGGKKALPKGSGSHEDEDEMDAYIGRRKPSPEEQKIIDDAKKGAEEARHTFERLSKDDGHERKFNRQDYGTGEGGIRKALGIGGSPRDWITNWPALLLMVIGIGLGFYLSFIHNLWIFGLPLMIGGIIIGWGPYISKLFSPLGFVRGPFSHLLSTSGRAAGEFILWDVIAATFLFGVLALFLYLLMGYLRIEYSIVQFVALGIFNSALLILLWTDTAKEDRPAPAAPERKALPAGSEQIALPPGTEDEGGSESDAKKALPSGADTKALSESEEERRNKEQLAIESEKQRLALEGEKERLALKSQEEQLAIEGEKQKIALQAAERLAIPEFAESAHSKEELERLKKKNLEERG
jgi:hypothetical protein